MRLNFIEAELEREFESKLFIWEVVPGNSEVEWELRIEAWEESSGGALLNRLLLGDLLSPSGEFCEATESDSKLPQ